MSEHKLNCETCGGALEYSADGLSAVCPYCGNKYNFAGEKSEALTLALNRANEMRAACDFDDAIREYKLITRGNPRDAEAWWGLALSIYGIEYVRDSRTGTLVPTCRRTVCRSILQDENFLNAVKYAAPAQAEVYRERAKVIDRLQRAIILRQREEEDYDVFICYRSADEAGRPTRERTVARRIYDELSRRGIKTFFSEVTLKSRLGEDFEPIIYKALYSCKFFILVACSEENLNTAWVKNEWSRFRDREEEEHLSGACCAVFDNMPLSALPPFLRSQQGVNLAKYPAGGYEIELADSIQSRFFSKYAPRGGQSAGKKDISSLADILSRAERDLKDEMYESAAEKFQRAIDTDPLCAQAWWGSFLAEHNAYSAGLAAQNMTYEYALALKNDKNLKNAELYGDSETVAKVQSFRKMCAFRCNELAVQAQSRAEESRRKLDGLSAERKKLASEREKLFRRMEKRRKDASRNPKFVTRSLILCAVFIFLFFAMMSAVAKTPVLAYVGLGMLAMCIFSATISGMAVKYNVKTAGEEAQRLQSRISDIDLEMDKMSGRREQLEREYSENNKMADAFRSVFKN